MKKLILSFVAMVVVGTLMGAGLPASAVEPSNEPSAKSIKMLKASIADGEAEEAADAAPRIYEATVRELLTEGYKAGHFQLPSFSLDDLFGVSFSVPMPLFSSQERYKVGDDYSSRLTLNGWNFVVYVKDTPISVFTIRKYEKGYECSVVFGQEFAINYEKAMKQLGTSTVSCVPVQGVFFLVSDDERVAVVNHLYDKTVYPLVSFAELNRVASESIRDDEGSEEVGGAGILSYLFSDGSSSSDSDWFSLHAQTLFFIIATVLLTGVLFFAIKLRARLSGAAVK